jgi:hypothetical protein
MKSKMSPALLQYCGTSNRFGVEAIYLNVSKHEAFVAKMFTGRG